MTPLLLPVLAASFLGSPHCAAMCGGFVCFVAGERGGRNARAQVAYHFGRLVSYATLGALAGALGSGLDRAGALAGVSRGAAIVAGAVLVVAGVLRLLEAVGVRLAAPAPAGAGSAGPGAAPSRRSGHLPLAAVLRAVANRPPAVRALALGLATTLLPCGFLWAFVATAAATGSAPAGALAMAVFWLGTVPVLAGLGAVARTALGPLQRRLPALTAVVLVVAGLLTLAGKLQPAPPGAACPAHAVHGRH